jgi:hypothetical protein
MQTIQYPATNTLPWVFLRWTTLIIIFLSVISCSKDSEDIEAPFISPSTPAKNYSSQVTIDWMQLFLEVERFTPGYRPPVSARAVAYLGLAGYEAVVPGMSNEFNSLENQFNGLTLPKIDPDKPYHWPSALNSAYGDMMINLFPIAPSSLIQKIHRLKEKYALLFESEVRLEIAFRSEQFGSELAAAIFNWSKTDQIGHEAYLKNTDSSYLPPVFPGSWQPTGPNFQRALLPYWGSVRTFAADASDDVRPPLPYDTDPNSLFYLQAKECMVLANNVRRGVSEEDQWIADFWSDDCPGLTFTPSARWIAIANQVLINENAALDIAVYTYAKIGMALNDAGIRCWHEKYKYNVLRPIDYIQTVIGEEDWNTLMCPDAFGTYTPSFPAYPSGHSTFGASAAEVLTDIFGISHKMTDRCHEGRTEFHSTPRSFNNFYEMAAENAYSRIPLGVHYRMDAEAGLNLGYKVGRKVNALPWKK